MSMKLLRRFNMLRYMVVQIKTLTAEPLRTRRIYFLFGGESPPNKILVLQSNQHPLCLWPLENTLDLFPQP